MKGLLKTLEKKHRLKEAKHFYNARDIFHSNSVHLCHQLNGYWFRISHLQWARLLEIDRETIRYRVKKGCNPAQILGFEKMRKCNTQLQ